MQVSQIFLTTKGELSQTEGALPFELQQATQSVKNCFPHNDYKLYTYDDLKELIKKNFADSVFDCFTKVKSYAFKADLARYCILYLHGGWYFDVSIRCLKGMQLPDQINILAFREINKYIGNTNSVDNSVIYASKPKQDIFLDAIDICVDHITANYYGWNPLCVTGPIVWGDVIIDNFHPEHYFFGDVVELTPTYQDKNKALVLPDGGIFALKKRAAGGDLSQLGAVGTNNYNELWQNRTLYK